MIVVLNGFILFFCIIIKKDIFVKKKKKRKKKKERYLKCNLDCVFICKCILENKNMDMYFNFLYLILE